MDDVINFIKENKKYYQEYFIKDRLNKCKYGYTCDVNQIYCYLNKVDIKKTEYYQFFKIFKECFKEKNNNIVDLSCGKIPILAGILKDNDYKVEAVNNEILINNYKNIITYEKKINNNLDLSKYDAIISLRPCDPTEIILNLCNKYQKNFCIYLCPCIHTPLNKKIKVNSYEEWINYLKKHLDTFKNYDIKFIYEHKLPDCCPVIIGKVKNTN